MAFDWNDYLEIAKKLKRVTDSKASDNANEALQRSAISRAYYAVYHLAVEYAEANLEYVPAKGETQHHQAICTLYRVRFENPDYQYVAKVLARLRKDRNDSDYKSEDLGNVRALLASVVLGADEIKGILAMQ